MTDADYYDRISASTEPITYCAECGLPRRAVRVLLPPRLPTAPKAASTSAPDWMADAMTDPNETANMAAGPMPGATGGCAACDGMGVVQDPMYGPTPCDQCNATGRALAADETASLVGQLTQGYREHLAAEAGPEIIAVPGRVLGGDIEGQADALADDAARLAELLAGFARNPGGPWTRSRCSAA